MRGRLGSKSETAPAFTAFTAFVAFHLNYSRFSHSATQPSEKASSSQSILVGIS